MTNKTNRLNDKGYTLIEMIIVMAIVVVLTGASMLTVSIMHAAKAKEAASTMENDTSDLHIKAKGQNFVDKNGTVYKEYAYALKLYDNNGHYYLQNTVVDRQTKTELDSSTFPTGVSSLGDMVENSHNGLGTSLSAYVYVKYEDPTSTTTSGAIDIDSTGKLIVFDKNGACVSGHGRYDFYKKSSDTLVASLTINKNGSIQLK